MAKADLTAERLREILHYDPESGIFTWIKKPHKKANLVTPGERAGNVCSDGYRKIYVDKYGHKEHRLAWLYINGEQAPSILDHINGNRGDNRFSNLRLATRSLNNQNRTKSRAKALPLGVHYSGRNYQARITATLAGKTLKLYLGAFSSMDEAESVYRAAKILLHPGAIIA